MKTALVALTLTLMAGAGLAEPQSRTFTGVISDSMCLRDHAAMKGRRFRSASTTVSSLILADEPTAISIRTADRKS
jgi:hypothetical protein